MLRLRSGPVSPRDRMIQGGSERVRHRVLQSGVHIKCRKNAVRLFVEFRYRPVITSSPRLEVIHPVGSEVEG